MYIDQYRVGFGQYSSATSNTTSLTADNHKWAASFTLPISATVTKIRILSGTNATAGVPMKASILDNLGHSPGPTTLVPEFDFLSTEAGTVTEIPLNFSATAGERYWLVVRNTTSTLVVYAHYSGGAINTALSGWWKRQDLGIGGWGTASSEGPCCIVDTDVGESFGFSTITTVFTGSTADTGFGYTSWIGAQFISPPNMMLNVNALAGYIQFAGTPTNAFVKGRIYFGETLIRETVETSVAGFANSTACPLNLSFNGGNVVVPPGIDVRVVFARSNGTASSYIRPFSSTMDNETPLSWRPVNGTFRRALFDGSSWSFVDRRIPFVWANLDRQYPILPAPLNRRSFNNQR